MPALEVGGQHLEQREASLAVWSLVAVAKQSDSTVVLIGPGEQRNQHPSWTAVLKPVPPAKNGTPAGNCLPAVAEQTQLHVAKHSNHQSTIQILLAKLKQVSLVNVMNYWYILTSMKKNGGAKQKYDLPPTRINNRAPAQCILKLNKHD